jgi:hypothetical protein
MPSTKPAPSRQRIDSDSTAAVDAFMQQLQHPYKDAIAALRSIVCGVDASIAEGVKWNAPSYRTHTYFATTHLRAKQGVGLILHLGAKVREIDALPIQDPDGLLAWLAKDRAMLTFSDRDDVMAKRAALETIVRQWIAHV